MKSVLTACLTTILLATASAATAWTLDGDASSLSYVSIKNADTAEANLLPGLSGMVGDDGAAEITIDLKSVETYVDIRNERMQEHLFKVTEFPVARLSAQLDLADYEDLAVGATRDAEFDVEVAANGELASYPVRAAITRIDDARVVVAAREPVILYADELGYGDGLNTLREIAGLDSIQLAVPVTFTLVFDK